MSNQSENEIQQTQTPEEVRQRILTELETNQQAIAELSDEELEAVAGGFSFRSFASGARLGISIYDSLFHSHSNNGF